MRQFLAEKELDSTGCLKVEGKKARYLTNVLRVQAGDMIYVRLLSDQLVQMTVSLVEKAEKYVLLQLAGDEGAAVPASMAKAPPLDKKNDVNIYLFQFIAKPVKMELIIRQAAECGVSAIIPVEGDFCQKGPLESARKHCQEGDDRWQKIIAEARQQSGSPVDTRVLSCLPVEKAVDLWQNQCGTGLVLYERTEKTQPLHRIIWENRSKKNYGLFVGAEGGISPREIDLLCKGGLFPVHFATNILRCETAAVYGLAALQSALMEKDLWQFKE